MRIAVLRSSGGEADGGIDPEYLQQLNTAFAHRVLGNLRDEAGFCTSCQDDCIGCRRRYRRSCHDSIAAVIDLPAVLPYLLESPDAYVPADVPSHDVLLAIGIHEQILLEVVKACPQWGTKGVVVPVEAAEWVAPATRRQAESICERHGVEIAFPKPFCAFDPPAGTVLADFRRVFQIGAPDVKLTVEGGIIREVRVDVSAACGATYYIARWLEGASLDEDLRHDVISRRLHSYPCTASMEWDDEIGDTPLHVSGKAHYRILDSLPEETPAAPDEGFVRSPLGTVLPKPAPIQSNLKRVRAAREIVLAALRDQPEVKVDGLRQDRRIDPAALTSALLELKGEGRIRIVGGGDAIRGLDEGRT